MRLLQEADSVTGKVGNFTFSGIRPEKLGSTEYTLVNLNLDRTGSTSAFASELKQVVAEVVEACKKSPRAEFLLLRYVQFNSQVSEVHGFVPVNSIDSTQLTDVSCTGATALYDAVYAGAKATNEYAKILTDQYYQVNAINITITDGDDNTSIHQVNEVKSALKEGVEKEVLESNMSILIGVNEQSVYMKNKLEEFKNNAEMDQYVGMQDVDRQSLAKLAKFISKSISSQSQSLGTGGKSQTFTF